MRTADSSLQAVQVGVVGLNHRAAPLAVREKLQQALAHIDCLGHPLSEPLQELVALSTCNRAEMYVAVAGHADPASLPGIRAAVQRAGISAADWKACSFHLRSHGAVHHLFRVASGLDSLIVGEVQILGQVQAALERAEAASTAGPVLNTLFQKAVGVGRQVRATTSLGRTDPSVSAAAVQALHDALGSLAGHTIALVGAGKVGALAGHALRSLGAARILVASRSIERACRVAQELRGEPYDLSRLTALLVAADALVSCTRAPHAVICRDTVEKAMSERGGRPLLILDLAAPRDVDPDVASVPGVTLRDVDDLAPYGAGVQSEEVLARAEEYVLNQVPSFMTWLRQRPVVPVIGALHQGMEAIRLRELFCARSRLGQLSDTQWEALDQMTRSIVQKMLHQPIAHVKESVGTGNGLELTYALRKLLAGETRWGGESEHHGKAA